MAFDFSKKDELERVVGLFRLGTWQELQRLCYRFDAYKLARELGVKPNRSERVLVQDIKKYIDEDYGKPPSCDCVLPTHPKFDPVGLRWLSGKATYYFDSSVAPEYDFDIDQLIDGAALQWMSVCGIELTRVSNKRDADIVITFADIDGRGRTLGMAYLPVSGNDMAACGGPCGDIIIDKAETWNARFFYAVFLHELGHAIGISHITTTKNINVLEPSYTGRVSFGEYDSKEAVKRYGKAIQKRIQEFKALSKILEFNSSEGLVSA